MNTYNLQQQKEIEKILRKEQENNQTQKFVSHAVYRKNIIKFNKDLKSFRKFIKYDGKIARMKFSVMRP